MNKTLKITLTAMFAAIGLLLPFLTGQIPTVGRMLLPMHIPVLLCGFICGWQYALPLGFLLPVTRSLIFSMPVLYPDASAMAFELAAYGFVSGFIYLKLKNRSIVSVYISLISALLTGRIVWGVMKAILLGLSGKGFTLATFFSVSFLTAWPGMILQLVLIPALLFTLDKTKIITFKVKGE